MKRASLISLMLSILLITCMASLHAAPMVDGFVSVPWRANPDQVDAAMKEQQAIPSDLSNKDFRTYDGLFAGEWRHLVFDFKYNSLFQGTAYVYRENVEDTARLWQDKLSEKYGPPWGRTEITTGNNSEYGRYNVFCPGYRVYWQGLKAGNGDEIKIIMEVRLKRLFYDSFKMPWWSPNDVKIIYYNSSLKQRLDDRGKDNY